nr:FadR/GntR family transcriptional regulator [uncultured Sellimonas sp.]
MAKPIKRVSLQSEIIKYIQSYIEEHDLKEGDRLPSQGQFIEMMQVSRTALREAVKTLEAEGIVEVKNGKGIFVGDRGRKTTALESLIGFTMERESLIEALEARRAMETELMAMVVRNATDQEMDELGEITEILMKKVWANERDTEEDKAFHEKIYQMCHNKVFYAMLKVLDDYTDKLWQFPLDIEDPFKASMPYHETLYQALRERDIKNAQKINNKLLDCVYDDIAIAHQ